MHGASPRCNTNLSDLIAGPLDAGWLRYFVPYEEVHERNLESVLGPD